LHRKYAKSIHDFYNEVHFALILIQDTECTHRKVFQRGFKGSLKLFSELLGDNGEAASKVPITQFYDKLEPNQAHGDKGSLMQAQLAPLQHALRKLQYESKAVASELEQLNTAASLSTGAGTRLQQMQDKAQALQQCIDDKLQQVWNCLCSVTLAFRL